MDETVAVRKKAPKHLTVYALLVVCALAVASSAFFYYKYQHSQQNKDVTLRKELVGRLGKVLQLPNADPSIVTVADKTKFGNPTLASRVENQDMLLIYNDAKRIIIYRPSSEKVVDMLTFENSTSLPKQ